MNSLLIPVSTDLATRSVGQQSSLLFAGIGAVLVLATLVAEMLSWRQRRRGQPSAVIANLVARIRAWWVMVREKTFCLDGLLCTVATGDERGAEHNLRSYLKALEAAGIVTRIASPRGGNAPAYRLEPARAGRKAPIVRNTQRQVVCGVTGEVIDIRKEPHRG